MEMLQELNNILNEFRANYSTRLEINHSDIEAAITGLFIKEKISTENSLTLSLAKIPNLQYTLPLPYKLFIEGTYFNSQKKSLEKLGILIDTRKKGIYIREGTSMLLYSRLEEIGRKYLFGVGLTDVV